MARSGDPDAQSRPALKGTEMDLDAASRLAATALRLDALE